MPNDKEGYEEPPELDDEDEAILDAIWDQIGEEDGEDEDGEDE
jgi:hypothetical protein